MDRRPAELVPEDMGGRLGDHLVSGLREKPEGDLVSHGRGGQVDGLLLPEQGGGPLLERDHGRVFAFLLVADDRLRHRPAHAVRRLRQRVRAKIDHGFSP